MGMYNILFGKNPMSSLILGMLDLTESDFGRFRDIYVTSDRIAVYTRLGGGNRNCYCESIDREQHHCYRACIEKLQAHPNYVNDEDDGFDCTYATFYFSFPEKYDETLRIIGFNKQSDPENKWAQKIEEIKRLSADELREKYPELLELVEKINKLS